MELGSHQMLCKMQKNLKEMKQCPRIENAIHQALVKIARLLATVLIIEPVIDTKLKENSCWYVTYLFKNKAD